MIYQRISIFRANSILMTFFPVFDFLSGQYGKH